MKILGMGRDLRVNIEKTKVVVFCTTQAWVTGQQEQFRLEWKLIEKVQYGNQ